MADGISRRVTTEAPSVTPPVRPNGPDAPTPLREPRGVPHGRSWRGIAIGAVALVALAALVWSLRTLRSQPVGGDAPGAAMQVSAKIERKDFVRTVRLNGIVEAVQSYMIAAPRLVGPGLGSLIITKLVPTGTPVKKGDLLVEFDRQNQIKTALDRQAEYLDFLEQIKHKRADQAAALAKDDSELHQAENAVHTAEWDVQKNEVVARIDAEKNLATLEQSKAQFAALKETYDLKRRAAAADVKILEIQAERSKAAMRHAQQNSEKLAIRAPVDGVVVVTQTWKNGQMGEVSEGDEVRAGITVMQVVDPSAMQVRARVNQADVPYLRAGLGVQVRLDAYPDLVFSGGLERLAAIGATGSFSNRVRTFVALFTIAGAHEKLMPDLSAAVDVELERRPGVLVAPRDAVFEESGRTFVQTSSGRREVKVGARSDTEVVIESGLEPGATVLRTARAPEPGRGNGS